MIDDEAKTIRLSLDMMAHVHWLMTKLLQVR